MKTIAQNVSLFAVKMSPKARLILFVATLALFVISAGAPDCGGGFIR